MRRHAPVQVCVYTGVQALVHMFCMYLWVGSM